MSPDPAYEIYVTHSQAISAAHTAYRDACIAADHVQIEACIAADNHYVAVCDTADRCRDAALAQLTEAANA
jgi:hypothetical protein